MLLLVLLYHVVLAESFEGKEVILTPFHTSNLLWEGNRKKATSGGPSSEVGDRDEDLSAAQSFSILVSGMVTRVNCHKRTDMGGHPGWALEATDE